ncbi:MAG: M55 family metallopeptidase [Chloroflexota bacterium]
MRVYISVDMEGISGVATGGQLSDPDYKRFCHLMTQDVNAAVEGAFRAGATRVLVNDAHGKMTNIVVEELDERATLISGSNKHLCQMEGIDQGFDAVFLVGYHAREGSDRAVINHSIAGIATTEIRRNGTPVGETAINAGIAGFYGVPAVLITGDDKVCAEAKSFIPDIETVVVKNALDRFAAEVIPPKKTREMIIEAAERALKRAKEIKPHVVPGPITFEVEFKLTNQAYMASVFPCVEKVGPKTCRVTDQDYPNAYRKLWGAIIVAMAATRGLFN